MLAFVLLFLWHIAFTANGVAAGLPSSLRIIGGQTTSKGQFPFQVSVRDRGSTSNFNHVCGGVIISQQDVLTAAQCVSDVNLADLYVVAGTTSLDEQEDHNAVAVDAARVKTHPSYKKGNYNNDLAIIRLAKRLPQRSDLKPADLLSKEPTNDVVCSVSGWGDTNGTNYRPTIPGRLRSTKVAFVSKSDCDNLVAYLQDDAVCSRPTGNRAAGACDLDNGGPLYCEYGLLGIYTRSETWCGTADSPGIYSSVPYHLSWIAENSDVVRTTPRPGTTTPGRGTTPSRGSTTPKTPSSSGPDTSMILSIVQIILICVVLVVLFVAVATWKK